MKSNTDPLKVAILGCGQISDAHLKEIQLIQDVQVVSVCDLFEAVASDTAARFQVPHWHSSYQKMIKETAPDIVHITLPPQLHRDVALYAIDNGCAVYIEKPFCTNTAETKEVIETAQKKGVLVCAGFSQVFDKTNEDLHDYLASGQLGDVIHVESYYGNSISGSFSKLFLQNPDHWIHRLPGKMFQNIVSHALYHIVPYFDTPFEKIDCISLDYSKNGVFHDELRLSVLSGGVTGVVTFSSNVGPLMQFYRIYGSKSMIEVDLANHVFRTIGRTNLPSALARVINPWTDGIHSLKKSVRNLRRVLNGSDRFFYGMGALFSRFYAAVRSGSTAPPIPYRDVFAVAEILDAISRQCTAVEHRESEK
jgi:predicted dehydrogenase